MALRAKHSADILLFPLPDGRMLPRHVKVADLLRRALARAGVVEGYDHVCRRKACGFHERHADDERRRCPKCNMRLWPRPIAKPLRFHDLRSTFATHLYERTHNLTLVQRALGHTTPVLTATVYAGVRDEHALAEVNKLAFGVVPDSQIVAPNSSASLAVSGTGPARASDPRPAAFPTTAEPRGRAAKSLARDTRFELVTFGSGGPSSELGRDCPESEVVGPIGESARVAVGRVAALEPASAAERGTGVARHAGANGSVFTVREVAQALKVSAATVYGWIARGELRAVRVRGSFLRIAADDLRAIVASDHDPVVIGSPTDLRPVAAGSRPPNRRASDATPDAGPERGSRVQR